MLTLSIKREVWPGESINNDPMSVVDSKFIVHDKKNLRIVDASVFPKIPGMFIVTPTYMISEKADEEIIDKWR